MTCHRILGGIVCVSPWGRLKLGNRYVEVSFHEYCGPSFEWVKGRTPYDPVDENDPIWPLFYVWFEKYQAQRAKRDAQRAAKRALDSSARDRADAPSPSVSEPEPQP